MKTSLRVSCLVFLVLALCMSESPVTESLFNKFSVQVVNNFKDHTLQAHCKSKDNDLGLRHVPVHGEFNFDFRINFFSSTLFWCNMWWVGGKRSFDVFIVNEKFLDNYCTLTYCRWKVQEDGIYVYSDKHRQFRYMYNWDN